MCYRSPFNPVPVPAHPASIAGTGAFPLLIPLAIGGAVIMSGAAGYFLARPQTDAQGNPIPNAFDRAAEKIGTGIGNAITISAVLGIGYLIFADGKKRK